MIIRDFLVYFMIYMLVGGLFILSLFIEKLLVIKKYYNQLSKNKKIIRNKAFFIYTYKASNKTNKPFIILTLLWPYYGKYIFDMIIAAKMIYGCSDDNDKLLKEGSTKFNILASQYITSQAFCNIDDIDINNADQSLKDLKNDIEKIKNNSIDVEEISQLLDKYKKDI